MIRATCTIKFGIIVTKEKLIPGFPETRNVNSRLPVPGIFFRELNHFPAFPEKTSGKMAIPGIPGIPGTPYPPPLCKYQERFG